MIAAVTREPTGSNHMNQVLCIRKSIEKFGGAAQKDPINLAVGRH